MLPTRRLQTMQHVARDIVRYRRLRRFQGDTLHCQQLRQLQQWQSQRVRQTYQPLFADHRTLPLMTLFLEDIFNGIDIPDNLGESAVSKIVQRFFKGTDMLSAVLEFNALTGEIDQSLTETLFEKLDCHEVTEESYLKACHLLRIYSALRRQKELILLFSDDLNNTLHNKVILSTIKMAKYPVQMIGLGSLYYLIEKGFAALKKTDNPEWLIAQIVDHENKIIQNMEANHSPVFVQFNLTPH